MLYYATIAEIDTFAEDLGEYTWLDSADDGNQAQLANDILEATLILDYANQSGAWIKGRFIRLGFEYMKIESFTSSTITVLRAQLGSVASDITAPVDIFQQDGKKLLSASLATTMIELYHGQKRKVDGSLFASSEFSPVAARLALYLAKVKTPIEIAERIRVISSGSFRDSNLSVSGAAELEIPDEISFRIDQILDDLGIDTGMVRS